MKINWGTLFCVLCSLLMWFYFFCFLHGLASAQVSIPEYDRKEWKHWIDEDGDCQNTRQEVLIRNSLEPVILSSDGCRVLKGKWLCPYSGLIFTNSRDLQIDHMVPLGNAHNSGGWAWSSDQKRAYANNIEGTMYLKPVWGRLNQEKSRQDPSEWLPSVGQCRYIRDWIHIKKEQGLSMTAKEALFVGKKWGKCGDAHFFER